MDVHHLHRLVTNWCLLSRFQLHWIISKKKIAKIQIVNKKDKRITKIEKSQGNLFLKIPQAWITKKCIIPQLWRVKRCCCPTLISYVEKLNCFLKLPACCLHAHKICNHRHLETSLYKLPKMKKNCQFRLHHNSIFCIGPI